jgi:ABC-type transport system substrate-binding protein
MYGYGAKYFAYSTPGDRRWALPDVPHYDHDPDAARRVLASLGLADHDADGVLDDGGSPVSFVLRTSSGNGAANFIRDDLAKVGIKVIVQQVEFNTLIAGIRNDFRYDAAIVGVSPRFPDPFFARNFWVSTGSHNWNPHAPGPELPGEARVDELIDGITSSTDFETRRQMWSELNAIANEQAWLVWLPVPDARVPVRDRFANVRPAGPNAGDILWNSEEFFVRPTARMMTP